MTIDYDPISSLEAVGYLEREASFLILSPFTPGTSCAGSMPASLVGTVEH